MIAYVGTIVGNNSTNPRIDGNPSDSSEDEDRANLDLPRGQALLINTVSETNPNTSAVAGQEVVQLYVASPSASDPMRPDAQLKAFKKISLEPGETQSVELDVEGADLWFWDSDADRKIWENGTWTLWVGPSSDPDDGLVSSFSLTGSLTPAINVVAAIPDGVDLNMATPRNAIHANLSATRNDDSFYDLEDEGVTVVYSSSDPSIAAVDAEGAVTPVSAGVAVITATVFADGDEKSTTFPVIVRSGATTEDGATIDDHLVDFGDQTVLTADAAVGIRLSAELTPTVNKTEYTYRLALNEENSADAVIEDGILMASRPGKVRVTALALSTDEGLVYSHTATITIVDELPTPDTP